MLLYTLVQMIDYLISVVSMVVIVQFVMSLLISFNVINTSNNAVVAIWRALNAILDPLLAPIRRFMPNTGGIDFSPMVLIVLLRLLSILLNGLAASGY
ncbi:YggT family protein [Novosphingobium capsulatum]|uniref:YggT family protein n=1 Tax=Novosphingobium capsulatum TaxID=13688 RepID=A0ABU1ML66_9SPHN|nr:MULTISPECIES: YggT family protein [Novosphingobium]MBB3359289.1 YggT family protein [Novosphingobium sp. BK256]MBB3375231.1 YggT family protein [Novosphingobium sp. BK280]MBB3380061.1 YggT family protein [Novosphingobium sp. BK258]MBB3421756.1 YggT family protein [Novosphingobium sp. BK267]MBB3450071.1 YggT family protein [Novosphingobium sp. BK352]MBB3478505.1 YggT family protein [Novosphingobium sp. BK369]MBB3501819.1 YggT family protein [Novosphingobium sp. BK336]MBB3538021.1 YggT fam